MQMYTASHKQVTCLLRPQVRQRGRTNNAVYSNIRDSDYVRVRDELALATEQSLSQTDLSADTQRLRHPLRAQVHIQSGVISGRAMGAVSERSVVSIRGLACHELRRILAESFNLFSFEGVNAIKISK